MLKAILHSKFTLVASIAALTLAACDSAKNTVRFSLQSNVEKSKVISGSVLGWASASSMGGASASASASTGTLSCSSGTVKVFRTNAVGEKAGEALASTPVDSSGTFKFKESAPYSADLLASPTKVRSLVLELTGCTKVYRRFVTGTASQDLSAGSELTSYLAGSLNLSSVKSSDYDALVASLKAAADSESAYNLISADADLSAKFQTVFGVASNDLSVRPPQVNEATVPTSANEGSAVSLGSTIVHWNATYTPVQEWLEIWTEEGTEHTRLLSTQAAFTWTPSANSQGTRKIRLLTGQNDGSGRVDTTKPYRTSERTLTVSDSSPALAPAASFTGTVSGGVGYTNNASISMTLATGSLGADGIYANCTTFSKLAVIVDESSATPTMPTDSDWSLACSSAGSQTVSLTLASEGLKTIRIWAKDSAGHISSASTDIQVHYSTGAPALTIAAGGSTSVNASSFAVGGTCDAAAGAVSISGPINNGAGQSTFTAACSSGSWTANLSLTGTDGNKVVTAAQTNLFGTTTTVNRAYTKDTSAPLLTVSSPANSTRAKAGLTVAGTCESGLPVAISGTGLSASVNAPCSGTFSQAIAFSAGDGNKAVTILQTDLAGNVTSISQTYVRDNVAPASPTMTLTSAAFSNSLNVTFTLSCAADVSHVLFSQSIVAPADTDPAWEACGGSDNYMLATGDGAKTIYGYSKDSSGNVSSVGSTVAMTLDQTAPVISVSSFTGGGFYPGGAAQPITWTASDVNFGATPIAIHYSQNSGSTYASIATVANTSPYSWSVPSLNIATARVRLTATDRAGNTTTSASTSDFAIDSTRPAAPAVTRLSNAVSNSRSVSVGVTCTADFAALQLTSTNVQPLASAGTWVACTTPQAFTVAAPDGAKSVYVWTKDAAGNVSSTAGSVSMTLDQTAPVINVTSPSPGFRGGTSTGSLSWTLTEANVAAATNFSVEIFNGTAWSSVGTVAATAGANSNSAYSLASIAIPSVNIATARLRVTLADAAAQSTTTQTNTFTIDSTAPSVTSTIINDGDASTGSAFVNMKVAASDTYGTVTHVRFAETSIGSSCQSIYADAGWMSYTNATTPIGYSMAVVDGVKKICAWAKDAIGNVSSFVPVEGTLGVDHDTIEFFIGNPPVITSLVIHDGANGENFIAGNPITINYAMTDAEGLSASPINLSVSVNGGAYTSIATDYGSLGGNPTSYSGSYTTFPAPNGAFRIKLVVRDSNNNSSVAAISNAMNATPWSIYMGTRDTGIGTGAKSTSLFKQTYGISGNQFAVNPLNGDLYAVSLNAGIIKVSAATGLTSTFASHNTPNFVDGMAISNLRVNTGSMAINFDKQGRLYISNPEGSSAGFNTKIWQIDFANNKVNFYAGGGTLPRAGTVMPATKTDAEIVNGAFDIDDSGSLYYFAPCDPSSFVSGSATLSYRLMKLSQNADGTPNVFTHLAGDCSAGNAVAGSNALLTGLGKVSYTHIRQISVNSDGSLIYISDSGAAERLVYDSAISAHRAYATSLSGRGIVIDRATNNVYSGNANIIKTTFASGFTGAETNTVIVTSNGTGNCNVDGTPASSACINAYGSNGWAPLEMANDGTLLFTDNKFRIRYVDSGNKLRTLAGTMPFYGEGLDRSFARGVFRGIYYKTSNNGTADFPKGLYFVEESSNVLGYVDPTTQLVSVVAGNQRQLSAMPTNGSVVGPNSDLGSAAEGTNFAGLDFDSDGYPLIVAGNSLLRIGAGKVATKWGGSGTRWQNAAHDAALSSLTFAYSFGNTNLVTVGNSLVYGLGIQNNPLSGPLQSMVGFANLTDGKFKVLMTGTASSSNPVPPDSAAPSTVNSTALSSACWNGNCHIVYNTVDSKLYYSEGNVIRALTNPTDPTAVTLTTVHSLGRNVYSFTFSPDNNRIYYVSNDNQLYCKWIGTGGAPANCTNSAALGPFAAKGFTTLSPNAPNRFAFINDGTLLIANGAEVLKYIYAP
jgi:hypothetical protein